MGVDLAPQQSPSAIAVVEREQLDPVTDPATFETKAAQQYKVRLFRRILPGPGYDEIAAEIRYTIRKGLPQGHQRIHLVLDATAIGKPVLDLMRSELRRPGLILTPVWITGQESPSSQSENRIPKRDLLQLMTVLVQQHSVVLAANIPERETLIQEIKDLARRDSGPANVELSWREKPNDDLVFAMALAIWKAWRCKDLRVESKRPLWLY